MNQLIKSKNQSAPFDLPVTIVGSLKQLKLARSQSLHAIADLSTAAAIDFQIELRNNILHHLEEIRLDLARQLIGNASRNGALSARPNRKKNNAFAFRRSRRLNLINRRH